MKINDKMLVYLTMALDERLWDVYSGFMPEYVKNKKTRRAETLKYKTFWSTDYRRALELACADVDRLLPSTEGIQEWNAEEKAKRAKE